MNYLDKIRKISNKILIVGAGLFIIALYLYWTGGWTTEVQAIVYGGLIILGLLAMTEKKAGLITKEDAQRIMLEDARKAQKDGLLEVGTIELVPDAVLRRWHGEPVSWDVCVKIDSPLKPHYVHSVDPRTKMIVGVEKRSSWSSADSPHVEVVQPPLIADWWRMRQLAERMMEEST